MLPVPGSAPMKEPMPAPRSDGIHSLLTSSRVGIIARRVIEAGSIWTGLCVRIVAMISVTPNRPIAMPSKPSPSRRSTMPNV